MTLVQYNFEGIGITPTDGTTISGNPGNSGSSAASLGGGTTTFRTAMAAHGSFGMQVANVSGSSCYRRYPLASAATTWQFSGVVTLPASAPPANTDLVGFPNSSGVARAGVYVNAAGNLVAWDVGSAHTLTLATPADGLSWGGKYRISIQMTGGSTTASAVTAKVYSGSGGSWTTQIGTTKTASNWNTGTDQVIGCDVGVCNSVAAALVVGWDDLQMNDGSGSEIGDYAPVNLPPDVTAGPTQTVSTGATVTLAFTASDTDGTISSRATTFTYRTSGSDPTVTGGTTDSPTFPAGTAPQRYVVRHTATDNLGATGYAETEVRVPVSGSTAVSPEPADGTGVGSWTNVGGASTEGAALADASDSTYVESAAVTGVEQTRRWRLFPSQTRATGTITIKVSQDVAGAITAKARLYEGSTMRQEWTLTTTTTPTDQVLTLSAPTIAAITDWGNLYLEASAT